MSGGRDDRAEYQPPVLPERNRIGPEPVGPGAALIRQMLALGLPSRMAVVLHVKARTGVEMTVSEVWHLMNRDALPDRFPPRKLDALVEALATGDWTRSASCLSSHGAPPPVSRAAGPWCLQRRCRYSA